MTLIQRHDGTTYDLLDYGIRTRDVLISAPTPDHEFGKVEGSHGVIDYGTTYGPRDITCLYRAQSHDITDFSLLRDEIFNIFRTEESFYLIEKRLPGKRWLVKVANPYQIPQRNVFGNFDIDFIGIKGVSESIGTTADIDGANLIPYADLSNVSNYSRWHPVGDTSFTSSSPVKYGGYDKEFLRVSVPSAEIGSNRRIRTGYDIILVNGRKYELSFIAVSSDWLDSSFNYTAILRSNGTLQKTLNLERTKVGEVDISGIVKSVYKYSVTYTHSMDSGDGYALMIGTKQTSESGAYFLVTEPSIKSLGGINSDDELWGFGMGLIADDNSLIYTHTDTAFSIYNAGSVRIHPFEQELKITISDVQGSVDYLQLKNITNGSTLRIAEGVSNSKVIVLDGANITNNGLQYLRNTNKQFIELASGWNNFQITGATSAKVSFDFPFYYL